MVESNILSLSVNYHRLFQTWIILSKNEKRGQIDIILKRSLLMQFSSNILQSRETILPSIETNMLLQHRPDISKNLGSVERFLETVSTIPSIITNL